MWALSRHQTESIMTRTLFPCASLRPLHSLLVALTMTTSIATHPVGVWVRRMLEAVRLGVEAAQQAVQADSDAAYACGYHCRSKQNAMSYRLLITRTVVNHRYTSLSHRPLTQDWH
ncbi:hypothetical protein K439DRAFT_562307 [Ramaria rubella]|nr:hypothetical protein K439DRAFT_562307 [Ramaria rubella]